jgi:hypothetical protein
MCGCSVMPYTNIAFHENQIVCFQEKVARFIA